MALEVEKVILVPRFTSFYGATTFLTVPVNVHDYASAGLVAWRSAGIGTSPVLSIQVQQSPDLDIWTTLATITPTPDETTSSVEFTQEWLRLAVALTGVNPGFTCWVVGNFVPRRT
jgi:hypothetical protein